MYNRRLKCDASGEIPKLKRLPTAFEVAYVGNVDFANQENIFETCKVFRRIYVWRYCSGNYDNIFYTYLFVAHLAELPTSILLGFANFCLPVMNEDFCNRRRPSLHKS